jgi:hypothetical protein
MRTQHQTDAQALGWILLFSRSMIGLFGGEEIGDPDGVISHEYPTKCQARVEHGGSESRPAAQGSFRDKKISDQIA